MANNFESFDSQLFSWSEWAQEGPMSMQFTNVTLKVPVGDYPVGTKFPFAFVLGEISLLVLIDDQQKENAFRLGLSVGEKVDPPDMECHDEGCTHHH